MTDQERETALWNEIRFRRKAIFRVWPEASISTGKGGFFWDWGQGEAVLVTPTKNGSPVYDAELSLLYQELSKIASERYKRNEPVSPSLQKVADMNQAVLILVGAACDDEWWKSDEVQDFHARMMGKTPLDRIAEATTEPE